MLCASVAKAQISNDSLKNIGKGLFQKQIENKRFKTNRSQDALFNIFVEELFPGCFKEFKIFLYRAENGFGDDMGSANELYVFSSKTGLQLDIKSVEEFNREFRNSSGLCNLDRCYLYLFTVEKVREGMTDPGLYRKVLNNNSVFLKQATALFHPFCFPCDSSDFLTSYGDLHRQIESNISRSTRNHIYMYVVYRASINLYEFVFRSGGILEKVRKTALE